ncbi:Wzz/FepE/Etk N-terminal domain-containing protein [Fictibacillus nanhaiensis]|uniref:YveK family protein n=1 Tax=Fictibacillus nanhaiensis TaxID=742169 RepID=UPI0020425790|nr:Wzz/FepE/Etk N-terminal domain-containing protein [Fictibacillus nanhaiensis]MCM3731612.1 Wzz/FepE/Etk N-terminal domain-containing protein [Fictibacillus nanhaiensis]
MEETISLKDIAQTLRKRLMLIALIAAVAVAVSGVISYFILTPVYQASTQILVNQKSNEQATLDPNQIRTNVEMINTYKLIITSPAILDIVVEDLKLKQSTDTLISKITVNSEQNSQVFSLTVQDEDPAQAVKIANAISETFRDEVDEIMEINNVKILSPAVLKDNPSPIKPKPLLNIAIALVVGLMAGIGIAFLLEYLDNTIKTEEDIQNILGLPVLGAIPKISVDDEKAPFSKKAASKRMGSETLES